MRKNTSRSAIYPCRSFLDGLEDSKQTTTAGADWPCFVSFCPITLMPSIDLASSRVHTHSSLTSTASSNCNPETSRDGVPPQPHQNRQLEIGRASRRERVSQYG